MGSYSSSVLSTSVLDPYHGLVEWFAFSSRKFVFLIFNQLICDNTIRFPRVSYSEPLRIIILLSNRVPLYLLNLVGSVAFGQNWTSTVSQECLKNQTDLLCLVRVKILFRRHVMTQSFLYITWPCRSKCFCSTVWSTQFFWLNSILRCYIGDEVLRILHRLLCQIRKAC